MPDDAGLLHCKELRLGCLQLDRVETSRLGVYRRTGGGDCMFYSCSGFEFAKSIEQMSEKSWSRSMTQT